MDWSQLPAINACLNGLATIFLVAGFVAIKSRKKDLHRKCMVAALISSTVFLAGYLTDKTIKGMSGGEVNKSFAGEGIWAWIYYPMLITHVILAIVILPLIFFAVKNAIKQNWARHIHWTKITWPLWMYVSVTGVLIYFFLYQWFPSEG